MKAHTIETHRQATESSHLLWEKMTSELPPLRARPKKNEPNNDADAALSSTQAATEEKPNPVNNSERASFPPMPTA
ncbi:hypothetical protein YC2023_097311 [Brassica napus]